MASAYYLEIIEEEKKKFKLGNKSLTAAFKAVSGYHWKRSIGEIPFPLDYNKAPNRCAYLYKFGTLHSGLVTKYFRKLWNKKGIKNILYSKKSIKLCCFGGGPGTDVFGVFKALTVNPSFHGKISEVTVLDKCGGWRNMFENIVSGLLDGKVKDIPASFINQDNFKHVLIEVDLLNPLPQNVMEIISNADIVCMSRFLSDVLEDERSRHAMKVLRSLIKLEALVLYIDIFNEKVLEFSEDIFKDNGFVTVLDPLHERFYRPSEALKHIFGSGPQYGGKFSIVGWCKTSESSDECKIFNGSYLTTSNSDLASEELSASIFMSDSEENYEYISDPVFSYDAHSQAESYFLSDAVSSDLESLAKAGSNTFLGTVSSEDEDIEPLAKVGSNIFLDTVSREDEDLDRPISLCDECTQTELNRDLVSSENKDFNALVKDSTCDEYTQTELNVLSDTVSSEDLEALVKATFNLLNVIEQWKQNHTL